MPFGVRDFEPTATIRFHLIEVLMVSTLVIIMSGISVSLVGGWLPAMRADAAMRQVVFQLTAARERAATQRRRIEIQFVGNNTLRIVRQETLPTPNTVLRVVPRTPVFRDINTLAFTQITTE